MIDIAWKNITKRKTRSILTIIGVAFCIQLMIILISITAHKSGEVHKMLSLIAGKVFIQAPASEKSEFPPLLSNLTIDTVQEILKKEYIDPAYSTPLLFKAIVPPQYPNEPPLVMVVGISPGKEKAYIQDLRRQEKMGILTGEAEIGDNSFIKGDEKIVILGSGAAKYYAKKGKISVGDKIVIRKKPFEVKGVLKETSVAIIDRAVLMPLSYAQRLFGWESLVSSVLVIKKSDIDNDDFIKMFKRDFPRLVIITEEKSKKNIEEALVGMHQFFNMTNNTAKGAAIIMILAMMIMGVNERIKEIGTLRAIGATRRTILVTILQESTILCFIAGIMGIILSYLVLQFVYHDTRVLNIKSAIESVVITVGIGIIGGLYPAIRAIKINPLEAIRYE
ncbi:MAG: FtsX-like permease family protein [bacterium]